MKNSSMNIHSVLKISVSEKIENSDPQVGRWTTQHITIETEDGDKFTIACFSPIEKEIE